MMKKYFVGFLEQFSYPEDAQAVLMDAFAAICKEAIYDEFLSLLKNYEDDMQYDFKIMLERMKGISVKAGIHEYTGYVIFLIGLSKALQQYYKEAGLDEDMWFATMSDLKWKLMECKEVYDIWGTFVPWWYDRFFNMERFCFGKLQFELNRFDREYKKEGISLKVGSPVLNVHIPRTGERLDRESMLHAYKLGSEFFKSAFAGEPIVFVCHSWLLFPRNKEVLSEQSNLYAFMSDYDVFECGEYKDYSQAWRLFDVQYDGDVEHLPQNTSLRRAYAEWIRTGRKMGWGYGVFLHKEN